jgi:folate-binding protein YgfZ
MKRENSNTDQETQGRFFVDVSSRSIVALRGEDAHDLLQRLSTNDLSKLGVGGVIKTILTNEKGRIIDVLSVLRLGTAELLLLGQTIAGHDLLRWLQKYIIMEDAVAENVTGIFRHLLVHDGISNNGALVSAGIGTVRFNNRFLGTIRESYLSFLERSGEATLHHTLFPRTSLPTAEEELTRSGFSQYNTQEYEDFRIAHGVPAYPNELSTEHNPLEVGLVDDISFTKGCYIGQEVIARLDTYKKVQTKFAQFELGAQPQQLPVSVHSEEDEAGWITSVASSNREGKIPALGFLRSASVAGNTSLFFFKDTAKIPVRAVS